ncbi:MAG: response regulator [Verrucomicrobiia bacterium]|jgi:two-component system chemotaxis response regulator CheY
MAYNILIVDDSLTARTFIARTLQMAEVSLNQIYHARNGQEALDLLQRVWVDLVFADINMPMMDGAEMVRQMRTMDLLKSIPVIIISTDRSAQRMAEMREAGVQAYLTKPITPEDLKAVVERFLKSA